MGEPVEPKKKRWTAAEKAALAAAADFIVKPEGKLLTNFQLAARVRAGEFE